MGRWMREEHEKFVKGKCSIYINYQSYQLCLLQHYKFMAKIGKKYKTISRQDQVLRFEAMLRNSLIRSKRKVGMSLLKIINPEIEEKSKNLLLKYLDQSKYHLQFSKSMKLKVINMNQTNRKNPRLNKPLMK